MSTKVAFSNFAYFWTTFGCSAAFSKKVIFIHFGFNLIKHKALKNLKNTKRFGVSGDRTQDLWVWILVTYPNGYGALDEKSPKN